jgi:hypothetical protein
MKPFISVDPIGDKNIGDQITITGKTSLPPGTEILVQVYAACYESGCGTTTDTKTGTVSGEFSGATGTVTVVKGTGNVNTWSTPIETKTFKSGEYVVTADSLKGDLSKGDYTKGDISGATKFTLNPDPASSAAGSIQSQASGNGKYIRIDPVPETTTGDLLIVSGTTDFSEGTILMVQTGSDGVGFGSDTMVREGTGGVNRFSMPVDTAILKPGTLTITVTQMKGDLAKGDYGPGTINGTTTFTLKGTYLGADMRVQATITKDDYIRINTIGDRSVGDQFLITGTTSLPAGTSLIWQVMPDTGAPPTGIDINATGGIMANNAVTKGDSISNRVSLAVDMSGFAPGKWVTLVGVTKGEPNSGSIEIENLTGSACFTLR